MSGIQKVVFDSLLAVSANESSIAQERATEATNNMNLRQALFETGLQDDSGMGLVDQGAEWQRGETTASDAAMRGAQAKSTAVEMATMRLQADTSGVLNIPIRA